MQSICIECNRQTCDCFFNRTEYHNESETSVSSISHSSCFRRLAATGHDSTGNVSLVLSDNTSNVYEEDTIVDTNTFNSAETSNYVKSDCSNMHDVSSPLSAHSSIVNLGLRGRGMRFGHFNIRGIRSGEKMDQIKLMLQSNENNISMLGVSETKLGSEMPDSFIQIHNFQCFRKDKIKGSGGLVVYVRNEISCSRRKDLENEHFESMWFEVFPTNCKSFLVGHFYRNPLSKIAWNEVFDEQMEKAIEDEKELFLLGDFNRDLLNQQIKQQWLDYMTSHSVTQHVNEPTRVVPNSSATLIDHIYSNFSDNIQFIDIPKIGLSDHYPVFVTRKVNAHIPKVIHNTIRYRSFKNFDEAKFHEELESIPWDVIKVFDTVDDALDAWYSLFSDVIDKHVPLKQHRVKNANQPNWLTPEIIEGIKTRDRSKAIGNMDQFKTWRNKVVNLIKRSKKSNYENLIEESNNQPSTIWKIFNELGAGKQKCNSASILQSVKIGNNETNGPADIANAFNDFFVNIAESIKESRDSANHEKLKDFCSAKIPENTVFDMPLLSADYVLKSLKNTDIRKSTGTDEIGPRLLKMAAPYIAESLTYICNLSVKSGTFPERWKEAKVKPLHKGGPSNDFNNFRPISILPVLSKLFEKHAHESLMNFLERYKLIYNTQSGFRPNHSCETALIHMVEKWLKALDKGELVGVLLVDFRKAFDLVDHSVLLQKMEFYKLNQNSLKFFKSYLTNRQQSVFVNNTQSSHASVKYGVPQGSILGPLLFLLFINDLPLHTDLMTDLYADDATLYETGKSKDLIERKLQKAISDLASWCKQNGMVINIDKTKAMLITTSQRRSRIKNSLQLSLNGIQLSTVSNDKVLGVQLDNNLSWGDHISKVVKKMSTNIWLLSKIKNYLSLNHRITYYRSYIQPHLDYANIVWGGTTKTNLMQIERLQKRACRIILDYNVNNVYQSLNDLRIMTISERVFFRKAKFMFKVSKGITPDYINSMFSKRSQVNHTGNESYSLRSIAAENFLLPKPNSELYRNSLAFSGPIIWNCLSSDVKSAPSAESFHNRCIKWMKNG